MSDEDPRLTELDMEVVTITRDTEGEVTVDGGGMTLESLCFLLRAAEILVMADFYYVQDNDDDDDEEV